MPTTEFVPSQAEIRRCIHCDAPLVVERVKGRVVRALHQQTNALRCPPNRDLRALVDTVRGAIERGREG